MHAFSMQIFRADFKRIRRCSMYAFANAFGSI